MLAGVSIDRKGTIRAVGQDGTTRLAARVVDGAISVMTMDGQDYELGFSGGARLKNPAEGAFVSGIIQKVKNAASQLMEDAKSPLTLIQRGTEIIDPFNRPFRMLANMEINSTLYQGEAVGRNLVDVTRTMGVKTMNGLGKTYKEISLVSNLGSIVTGAPVWNALGGVLGVDITVPTLGDLTGWTQVEKSLGGMGIDLKQVPTLHGMLEKSIQGMDWEKGLEWAEDRMGILGQFSRDQGWNTTVGVKVYTMAASVFLETPHQLFGLSSNRFYEANGGFAKGKGMELVNGVFNAFMFAGGLSAVVKGGFQRGMMWVMTGPRAYVLEGTFAAMGTHGVVQVWKGNDSFKGKVVDTLLIAAPVGFMLRTRLTGELGVRGAARDGNAGLLNLAMDKSPRP